MYSWKKNEDHDSQETKWETDPWTGWTVFENVHGVELWWKFQFIGKFESPEDAFHHVQNVEDIDAR